MAQELAEGCPSGPLFAQSLSMGVAMRLHQRSAGGAMSVERGRLSPAQLKRVNDLIHARLSEEISLAQLAEATGLSPSQFVRVFKKTMGCTPYRHVMRCRLAQARELVLKTRMPLVQVASVSGFASQSHMTAAFVRTYQLPPGAMRRQAVSR